MQLVMLSYFKTEPNLLIICPKLESIKVTLNLIFVPEIHSFALFYLLKIGGVYLPSLEASERIDWIAFLRPFQWTPWLMIVFSILISSIVSAIIWFIRGTLTFRKLIKIIWTNVQAFFDEASDLETQWINLRFSHRLATFISLLWAWFIWTSYNAALASEFTVPIVKLPFTDMESLSTTDYR